jgi:hypothetical protein
MCGTVRNLARQKNPIKVKQYPSSSFTQLNLVSSCSACRTKVLYNVTPLMTTSDHQMYNVGGSWSVLMTNCTVIPLRTPFGLVIPLLQSSITRNYNHTQLSITRLRVYTIIITYMLVTKVSYNTVTRLHRLTSQLSLLSRIITHSTSSHFPCLSPIETSLIELLPNTDP